MTSACSRSAATRRARASEGASIGGVPYPRMDDRFGVAPFALGVEEELLLVDPETHLLAHAADRVLADVEGLKPALYLALVESVSPISRDVEEAVGALSLTRARAREAGATLAGAGVHPAGPFGEAPHVDDPRYEVVGGQLRG